MSVGLGMFLAGIGTACACLMMWRASWRVASEKRTRSMVEGAFAAAPQVELAVDEMPFAPGKAVVAATFADGTVGKADVFHARRVPYHAIPDVSEYSPSRKVNELAVLHCLLEVQRLPLAHRAGIYLVPPMVTRRTGDPYAEELPLVFIAARFRAFDMEHKSFSNLVIAWFQSDDALCVPGAVAAHLCAVRWGDHAVVDGLDD